MAKRKERLMEKASRIMQEELEIRDDQYGNGLYDDPYSDEFYRFKEQQEEERRWQYMTRHHQGWD